MANKGRAKTDKLYDQLIKRFTERAKTRYDIGAAIIVDGDGIVARFAAHISSAEPPHQRDELLLCFLDF